jgi:hypothetical protein
MDDFAQSEREAVGECVEDVAACVVGMQDAVVHEFAKVFGHIRLRGSDCSHDLRNTSGLVAKTLEDCQSQGVAEGAEEAGYGVELFRRQGFFFR